LLLAMALVYWSVEHRVPAPRAGTHRRLIGFWLSARYRYCAFPDFSEPVAWRFTQACQSYRPARKRHVRKRIGGSIIAPHR